MTIKTKSMKSLTWPLMLSVFVVTIPKVTKGKLVLVVKNKAGQPLITRLESLEEPHGYFGLHTGAFGQSGQEQYRNRARKRRCQPDEGMAGDNGLHRQTYG